MIQLMPSVALVGLPGPRWLPPLPLPLFLLWPIAWMCLGAAKLLEFEKPEEAEKLRTAMHVFRDLRGLSIDVRPAEETPIRIRFL